MLAQMTRILYFCILWNGNDGIFIKNYPMEFYGVTRPQLVSARVSHTNTWSVVYPEMPLVTQIIKVNDKWNNLISNSWFLYR